MSSVGLERKVRRRGPASSEAGDVGKDQLRCYLKGNAKLLKDFRPKRNIIKWLFEGIPSARRYRGMNWRGIILEMKRLVRNLLY